MTDQQNAALEPCPFCGGEAAITEGPAKGLFGTACSQCGCWNDSRSKTEAEAIAAWNTRPAPAGAEAVREALLGECVEALRVIAFDPHNATKVHQVAEAAWHHSKDWRKALAKAPSTGEGKCVRITASACVDEESSSVETSPTPQPAPTAAEDGLREALEWAIKKACEECYPVPIHKHGAVLQRHLAALRAKPEASTEKGRP